MALLDMLARQNEHELVVAHFDHGIRPGSADDAAFVAGLSRMYGLAFETRRVELGADASEERARDERYAFLNEIAARHDGVIVTAHHMDDVIETIAINQVRGTGWRGLAVLNDPNIGRPLLGMRKTELYDYAIRHGLEWVEDETNRTDTYLRNRLRGKLNRLPDDAVWRLIELWRDQRLVARQIDDEARRLTTGSRYFLNMIDDRCGQEILRRILSDASLSLTRPQRSRVLHAIRTARPGSMLHAGSGVQVSFTMRDFIVKHP